MKNLPVKNKQSVACIPTCINFTRNHIFDGLSIGASTCVKPRFYALVACHKIFKPSLIIQYIYMYHGVLYTYGTPLYVCTVSVVWMNLTK